MTIQDIEMLIDNHIFSEEPIMGSLNADKKYANWIFENYVFSSDEVYCLFRKKYKYLGFSEQYLTNYTTVRINYDKNFLIKNLEHIEYDNEIYVLIEKPEKVTDDLYSAHAFKLGDEIENETYVPLYNIAWENTEDEDDDILIEDVLYVQNLEQNYNINKGSI